MKNVIGKILLVISLMCAFSGIILIFVSKDMKGFIITEERLNLEKFNEIKIGMTYEEVVGIIGEEGTVLSETEIANIRTVIYSWYGDGITGANANVTFQNGEVISKAQIGLK